MSDEQRIVEIEAFRAGGKSARGITAAQLDEAIASYNSERDPAPLVFGHPESNDPAHGVIASLRREGNKLITGLKNISQDAIEGVKAGKFLNRSIAFWHPDHSANPTPGKWNIRHLGLLGAASPGIPGMSKLAFSADETAIESADAPDTALIFTEDGTTTVVITERKPKVADPKPEGEFVAKTDFDAVQTENERLKSEAKARADADEEARKTANGEFVAEMVKQGRVTPGFKDQIVTALNLLPVQEVQFNADAKGTPADGIREFLKALPEQVTFTTISPTGERQSGPMTAEQITAKANQLVKDGKAVSFEAAVETIEKQGA